MKKHFKIETINYQTLGEMNIERKIENDIMNVHVEQFLYNTTRINDIRFDTEGNVLKYSLEISDWLNEHRKYNYEYQLKDNIYIDTEDAALFRANKQIILESLYLMPKYFFEKQCGEIKIFDFVQNLHTKLIYKSWNDQKLNFIQITAPACIRIIFSNEYEFVRYEDMNSKIIYQSKE